MKVAIIDDDSFYLKRMREVLCDMGHQTYCIRFCRPGNEQGADFASDDGDDIAQAVMQCDPDYVFVDHALQANPDRFGLEIVELLKEQWPAFHVARIMGTSSARKAQRSYVSEAMYADKDLSPTQEPIFRDWVQGLSRRLDQLPPRP